MGISDECNALNSRTIPNCCLYIGKQTSTRKCGLQIGRERGISNHEVQ